MIQTLFIENFGTIAHCELSLQSGMIALTGESGAGKSLIIDALLLLAGARADTRKVGPWGKHATVIGAFHTQTGTATYQCLHTLDLLNNESPNTVLIRRVISENSQGNKIYINDRPITAQTLNTIGAQLIGSHGQHAHLALLKPSVQLKSLDAFAQCHTQAAQLREDVKHWQALDAKCQQLRTQILGDTQAHELLRYQLEELEALHLTEEAYPELNKTHWDLSQGENRQQLACEAIDDLSDAEHSIINRLNHLSAKMAQSAPNDEQFSEVQALIAHGQSHLQEAYQHLRQLNESIELDPAQLAQLDQQLTTWHDIARKHRVEPEQLYTHQQQLITEQQALADAQQRLETLEHECQSARTIAEKKAKELSQQRAQSAIKMSQALSEGLNKLGMAEASLSIELERKPLSTDGIDQIQFLVQTNRGHAKGPLAEVASGGELARISLTVLLLNGQQSPTPTVIFDEVDTGTSGAVAAKIGQLLKQLGQHAQVISISHLPQIAACANEHIFVTKDSTDEHTKTTAVTLTSSARELEIARLLGADDTISHSAKANAKALLAAHRE
tara:strand:+ start:1788 stop:3464 length:1677 start_codon:yes stop_codon:yes gene_type:complete